jgi:hypothetical protein
MWSKKQPLPSQLPSQPQSQPPPPQPSISKENEKEKEAARRQNKGKVFKIGSVPRPSGIRTQIQINKDKRLIYFDSPPPAETASASSSRASTPEIIDLISCDEETNDNYNYNQYDHSHHPETTTSTCFASSSVAALLPFSSFRYILGHKQVLFKVIIVVWWKRKICSNM